MFELTNKLDNIIVRFEERYHSFYDEYYDFKATVFHENGKKIIANKVCVNFDKNNIPIGEYKGVVRWMLCNDKTHANAIIETFGGKIVEKIEI